MFARERELEVIDAALATASAGSGSVLVIEGAAGIGKTSLLAEARERARAGGMLVLHGRGGELERDDAFGVARQCLEPAVRRLSAQDRERLLEGAAGLAAPAVLEPPVGSVGSVPVGVLHGLYWMVAGLCDRASALLVVDDVQWADQASLRFLGYVARRVESIAAVVAVGLRLDSGVDVPPALELIRGDPDVAVLRPRPLGGSSVTEYLGGVGGCDVDREFAEACERACGGNPFLLGELARALIEERVSFTAASAARVSRISPPRVVQAVRARLDRLSAPAQALAEAIAVLGDDTPLELAWALAGVDSESVEAVRELTSAGVLDDIMPPGFRHPILRGAVLEGICARDLDCAHARAAALLQARRARPDRVAVHLLATSPAGRPEVVAGLKACAAHARSRGAPETAAALLRRALVEPPEASVRDEVLLELGLMELAAGETRSAADHLEQACREAADPATRARALISLASARGGEFSDWATIEERVAPALDALGDRDSELAWRLKALALMTSHGSPDGHLVEDALQLSGDTPGEATVLGHLIFSRMRPQATAAEIADLAQRATRHADVLGDGGLSPTAFVGALLALRWTDRLDAAERVLDRAILRAQQTGSLPAWTLASTHRALVLRRRGRLREAEADARAVLATTATSSQWPSGAAAWPLIMCQLDAGRIDEAARTGDGAGLGGHIPNGPPFTAMLLTRMRLEAARGEADRALEDWAESVRRRERLGPVTAPWIEDCLCIAELHDSLGNRDAALALVNDSLTLARCWDTPGAIGQTLRTQARIGATEDPIQTLEEASALLGSSPARLEHARALIDLGGTLRRRGYRRDARHPLRAGYELARECGADALTEYVRSELAASGVRLRRASLSGGDSLTASEQRIAQMAASGASNMEIAQALFVTVKTVEMHLTHVYRKLDIAKRSQLPRALAKPGPQ